MRKMCPLLAGKQCVEDRCAFWDDVECQCVIHTLIEELRNLRRL